MSRSIRVVALVSASVVALGGLSAACEPADNEPQAKRTVAEQTAKTAKKPPAPKSSQPLESVSEANARASAEQYLSGQSFSRSGLIKQLKFEGFSTADATYGVGAVSVDWNEQAAKSAEQYLSGQSFSRSGLVKQLKFEGFTAAQAEYGVGAVSVDWNEQAAKSAEQYLSNQSFSRTGLIEQLKFEGFTEQQAVYGVNQTGL